MTRSEVTVLMPTCNRSALLRESIDAVLAELEPGDELLVIDDGSSDDTVELLTSYGSALHFVSVENGGKPAALNLGLEMTHKPLVWIVDDDDIVLTGTRNKLVSLIDTEGADVAYGRYDRFLAQPNGRRETLGTGYWMNCEPREVLIRTLEDAFIHQPGFIAKRSLYEKVGRFSEQDVRSNDYEMLIRLLQHGNVRGTDDVVFLQRTHDGLRGHGNDSIRDLDRAWIESDQAIFKRIRSTLPLECYKTDRSIATEQDQRMALLQRGVVYARHKLWTHAIDDFANAAKLSDTPLNAEERSIVRQAVFSKYGCSEIIEDDSIYAQLCDRLAGTVTGEQIVANLSRALMYHVKLSLRNGKLKSAARYGQRVLQLASETRSATKQVYGF